MSNLCHASELLILLALHKLVASVVYWLVRLRMDQKIAGSNPAKALDF
jgi:hypothetical protein